MSEDAKQGRLQALPIPLLSQLASFLEMKERYETIGDVCASMRKACESPLAWDNDEDVHIRDLCNCALPGFAAKHKAFPRRLSVGLHGWMSTCSPDLASCIGVGHVQHMGIYIWSKLSVDMINASTALQTLDVCCEMPSRGFDFKTMSNSSVKSVVYHGSAAIVCDDHCRYLQLFPALETFQMGMFAPVLLVNSPLLRIPRLRLTGVSLGNFEVTAGLPSLFAHDTTKRKLQESIITGSFTWSKTEKLTTRLENLERLVIGWRMEAFDHRIETAYTAALQLPELVERLYPSLGRFQLNFGKEWSSKTVFGILSELVSRMPSHVSTIVVKLLASRPTHNEFTVKMERNTQGRGFLCSKDDIMNVGSLQSVQMVQKWYDEYRGGTAVPP